MDRITVNSRAVVRFLAAVAALLVLASLCGQLLTYLAGHDRVFGLVELFNVDAERNVPTTFAVFLLLLAALLLAVITGLERRRSAADVKHWAVLTLGFLYMAVDEAFSIHEQTILPLRALLGDRIPRVFYYTWVVPGLVIVCLVFLFYAGFLQRLPAETRRAFLVAGTLFVGGSIGVELVGGWYAQWSGTHTLAYNLIVTVEESLEMAGVIVFVWALLGYISERYKDVRFTFMR